MISDKLLLAHLTIISLWDGHSSFAFSDPCSILSQPALCSGRVPVCLCHLGCFVLWLMGTPSGYWRAGGKGCECVCSLFFLCCPGLLFQRSPSPSISAAWVAAMVISGIQKWFSPCPTGEGRRRDGDILVTNPGVPNQPLLIPLYFAHTFVIVHDWMCHCALSFLPGPWLISQSRTHSTGSSDASWDTLVDRIKTGNPWCPKEIALKWWACMLLATESELFGCKICILQWLCLCDFLLHELLGHMPLSMPFLFTRILCINLFSKGQIYCREFRKPFLIHFSLLNPLSKS